MSTDYKNPKEQAGVRPVYRRRISGMINGSSVNAYTLAQISAQSTLRLLEVEVGGAMKESKKSVIENVVKRQRWWSGKVAAPFYTVVR